MTSRNFVRSAPRAALGVTLGSLLLAGCALIQPPPVPQVPHFGLRAGAPDASCTADVARAHGALAEAGAAAGDPAATAAAHARAAEAMAAYQVCLSQPRQP
jgi:hypothetical protein